MAIFCAQNNRSSLRYRYALDSIKLKSAVPWDLYAIMMSVLKPWLFGERISAFGNLDLPTAMFPLTLTLTGSRLTWSWLACAVLEPGR